MQYARFLEDVVKAMSPQMTWEFEVTRWTIIRAG